MDTKQLILNGELARARQELIQGVKKDPANTSFRTQLFQVLVFLGEWDKALVHLKAMPKKGKDSQMGHEVYANLIRAEKERTEVINLKKQPSFLPKRPAYADLYLKARALADGGEKVLAEKNLNEIDETRPLVSGTFQNKDFSGFSNTDPLLANFIEIMEYERYLWIPVEELREMIVSKPQTLMDTVWARGSITTWTGLTMGCFFPVLYPLSHTHEDDRIKMGRMTDWQSPGVSYDRASGQQVFQVGEKDVPILEMENIQFNLPIPKDQGSRKT